MSNKPRMTLEQFRALAEKRSERPSKKKNKYGAVAVGGHASGKEHRRAEQLRLLERIGEITSLREQVPYLLIPPKRNSHGYFERACKYVADFVYVDKYGNTIVEDTKGFRTKEYVIKRKLMLMVHNITITEI